MQEIKVQIPANNETLTGIFAIPKQPKGLIIFSHGINKHGLHNKFVASYLRESGFSTFLPDLLKSKDQKDFKKRFDIEKLSRRLVNVTHWIWKQTEYKKSNIGYFGTEAGTASALLAASSLGPDIIKAIVSSGGRPDLASGTLPAVKCPTLLLVGGLDTMAMGFNEEALKKLTSPKKLVTIPGATHLFDKPGKLKNVAELTVDWFLKYLLRYQRSVEKNFLS